MFVHVPVYYLFSAIRFLQCFGSHNANKQKVLSRFFLLLLISFVKEIIVDNICFPDAYSKRNFCTFYGHVGTSFYTYYDIQGTSKCVHRVA